MVRLPMSELSERERKTLRKRNREASADFRARNKVVMARRDLKERQRTSKRVNYNTMSRLGVTPEMINAWRREFGVDEIDFSLYPISCASGVEKVECVQVERDPASPPAPTYPEVIEEEAEEEAEEDVETPAQPDADGGPTVNEILKFTSRLPTFQKMNKDGVLVFNDNGSPALLAKNNAPQTKSSIRTVAKLLGCTGESKLAACLDDWDDVVKKVQKAYPNKNTAKAKLGAVGTILRYNEDFRNAVPASAKAKIQASIKFAINVAKADEVNRTEDVEFAVPSWEALKRAVDELKAEGRREDWLRAYFQVVLTKGQIRDDCTRTRVYTTEKAAVADGSTNYLALDKKKLVIIDFKTKGTYPGYEFNVSKPIIDAVKALKRRNKTLLFKRSVGQAFETVESIDMHVTANVVRHSSVNHVSAGKRPATWAKNAPLFKHSYDQHLKYLRETEVVD